MTTDLEDIFIRNRVTIHRTPSPNNTQPWTINFGDESLIIGFNSSRMLPVTDPLSRDLCLSLGMFIESIAVVVGEETGKAIDVAYRSHDDASAVCDITLSKSVYVPIITSGDLNNRSTNRKPYNHNEADRANIERLLNSAECSYVIHDSETFAPLLDRAVAKQMSDAEASEEHNRWLRAERTLHARDGLSSITLNIKYTKALALKVLLTRPVHSFLKRVGLTHTLVRTQPNMLDTDSLLVAFTSEYEPPSLEIITAGRSLLHSWCLLCREGFSVQPLSLLLNVPETNRALHEHLQVDNTTHIVFVIRVGFSDSHTGHSRRLVE